MNKKEKQKEFMNHYNAIHIAFVRYCKAKSYGIMDYKDLVSESVLRAFESFEKIKNKEKFPAFIFNISSNILKNELRKKYRTDISNDIKINYDNYSENSAIQKFEIDVLYKALANLPEEQKEAIILFEISGYSIKEITIIQSCGESAVKQRLKRGREKLALILGVPQIKKENINKKSGILLTLFFEYSWRNKYIL